ncbi:MAG: hypothetical protein U0414_08000 [Polyangiaceae bacterium]
MQSVEAVHPPAPPVPVESPLLVDAPVDPLLMLPDVLPAPPIELPVLALPLVVPSSHPEAATKKRATGRQASERDRSMGR